VTGATLETERFVEREVIGRGGSGVVIRAFDKDILREVAIKVLDPDLVGDGSEIERFAEEAQISGQLEHPNIVPVYEFGVDLRGRRFLCMKLVQGITLEDALHRHGDARLDADRLADLLQVFVKVCDAVSFAHSRGVIHRDLKPSNIMISDFGQVYVLDWGIALLTPRGPGGDGARVRVSRDGGERLEELSPGSVLGTAYYMAPEQLAGDNARIDERTDVFALGATLYQVLAGRPPLTGEMVRAIWTRQTPPPIPPPDAVAPAGRVPVELAKIATRAMSFDPQARYASVEDLRRDVALFQRGAWDLPRLKLPAGSTVVRHGEPGKAAYVILEGRCGVYRVDEGEETELRVLGPGDVFGEAAVFSDKPRTASVKAVTDVVLQVVTSEVLSNAVGLNSWVGAFVRALADRFRDVDERLRIAERTGRAPESRH